MDTPRTTEVPTLDEQLCFDLYAASRSVTAAYQPGLDSLGLSYEDYLVLLVLWEHPGVSVPTIARHLRAETTSVVLMLRRMTARGLVTREGEVEMAATIRTTAHGESLKGPVSAIHCELRDALGISPSELRDLQLRLREVGANARLLTEAHAQGAAALADAEGPPA